MTETLIYSLAISTMFFLFKFLEMKFLPDDEKKPLKVIIKETILVYFSAFMGIILYAQFDIKELKGGKTATMAFVDNPGF
jgi:hypothetical protein